MMAVELSSMDKRVGSEGGRPTRGSQSSFLGANEVAIAVVTATLVTVIALLLALVFYLIRTRSACGKPNATDEEKQSVLIKPQPPSAGVNTLHGAKVSGISSRQRNFLNLPSQQEEHADVVPSSNNGKHQTTAPNLVSSQLSATQGSTSSKRSRGSLRDRRLSGAGSVSSLTLSIASSTSQVSNTGAPRRPISSTTCPENSKESKTLDTLNKPLSFAKLESIVENLSQLSEEFMRLPNNFPQNIDTVFDKQKNRHGTLLPNNQSRIRLSSSRYRTPAEGYINANLVRGYMKDSAYIAAQGPLPSTIDDFWWMIWQEKVSIIVMLTRTREKTRTLCEKYWPLTNAIYGDIMVTCKNSCNPDPRYQLNDFLIANIESANQRRVEQYWYQEWPDKEEPEDASGILTLIADIEKRQLQTSTGSSSGGSTGPILVHCSAGLGRTGCFIALSSAIERYEYENNIDILGTVAKIRLDRGGMVQTLVQYEFIHKALLQYIKKHSEKRYITSSRCTQGQIPE